MSRALVLCMLLGLAGAARAAAPQALAGIGDTSPLGLPFSRFSDAAIDDRGRVVFLGASTAIFRRTDAGLVRLVGAGDALGTRTLAAVGAPALGSDGCVAFSAAPIDGDPLVVRRCAGGFESLVTVGTAAPGGGTFTGFGPVVAIGRDGQVAFTGFLDDGHTGLFRADAVGLVFQVARTGETAPSGGVFVGLRLIGVSESGRVGFRGLVSGGPDGLFVWNGIQIAKLVVVGDLSPAGGQFTAFGGASVNDADVYAFRATIARPTSTVDAVFRADAALSTPVFGSVVVEGDPSPIGGRFRELPTSLVPTVNAAGAIAVRSTLVDAPSSAGIFVGAPDGSLARVVLVGDQVPIDAQTKSDLRRLRDPTIADDGSVLLRASLAAGTTGLFTARGTTVRPLALLGEATDLGGGFRFSEPTVRATAESGLFLGLQEAVYVSEGAGSIRILGALGGSTPLGGTYIGFDPPAAGARGHIAFGASLFGGRAGEAIISTGGRAPTAPVRNGRRAPGGGELVDLFVDTVDSLARPGLASGGVAFNAALGRTTANAGVFLLSGGRLRAIARAGAAAAGGRLVAFGTPANVGRGQAAFVAQVRGGSSDTVLLLKGSGRARTVAAVGAETGTRLASRFRALDPPGGLRGDVLFRATLAQSGLEGLFLARKRSLVAVVGSGDGAPGGGNFQIFSGQTLAAANVVFHATVGGERSARGLFRVAESAAGALIDPPPPADAVLIAGDASPLGGTFLDFAGPSGNPAGAIAFTADLLGGSAPGGVFLLADTQRNFP